MFPGPGAHVYYNDAGEPLGWDYPSYDPPEQSEPGDYGYDDREECGEPFLSEDKDTLWCVRCGLPKGDHSDEGEDSEDD